MDILEAIQEILLDLFEISPDKVKPESTLEELGLDEVEMIGLEDELADQFLLEYLYDDEDIVTIADMIRYVEREIEKEGESI